MRTFIIATATKGGWVEIHELVGDGGSRLAAKLEGAHGVHKVYGVAFSPLVPGKLMSVSDDKTARVWTIGPYFRETTGRAWTTLPQAFREAGWRSIGHGKIFHEGNASGWPLDQDQM